jgi:invasion protein IalB
MVTKLGQVVRSCLLVLTFSALASVTGGARPAPAQTQAPSSSTSSAPSAITATCDLSNPGYSGWCRVTKDLAPGKRPRAFCAQVLACMNDVRCNKTYCDATTIRGGWRLEKVEKTPQSPKAKAP